MHDAGHLGLELGKTLKLEWYRAANTRIRCLRITSKEEKAVRGKMQVLLHPPPPPPRRPSLSLPGPAQATTPGRFQTVE